MCLEDFTSFVHPKRPVFYATLQEAFSFALLGLDAGGGWLADGSEEINGRKRTFFSWAAFVRDVA